MKRLNINRELFWFYINSFELNENYRLSTQAKPNGLTIVTLQYVELDDNSKPATLNVYENKDGTTTIDYERGKNVKLSKNIAEGAVNYSILR